MTTVGEVVVRTTDSRHSRFLGRSHSEPFQNGHRVKVIAMSYCPCETLPRRAVRSYTGDAHDSFFIILSLLLLLCIFFFFSPIPSRTNCIRTGFGRAYHYNTTVVVRNSRVIRLCILQCRDVLLAGRSATTYARVSAPGFHGPLSAPAPHALLLSTNRVFSP